MPHIPYAPLDIAPAELVERIGRERGSVPHLYRMLLHSPPLADGWLTLLTAVRTAFDLPADLRELAIIRIAHLNGAEYEAEMHLPFARQAGLTEPEIAACLDLGTLDPVQGLRRQTLDVTDSLTLTPATVGNRLRLIARAIGERQATELAATIAAYNMVSRFIVATGIHHDDKV